jgi:hypothetical protein
MRACRVAAFRQRVAKQSSQTRIGSATALITQQERSRDVPSYISNI